MSNYPDVNLFIDGEWQAARDGQWLTVENPATGDTLGRVARAGEADLEAAAQSALRGFKVWRDTSAYERSKIMRQAAVLLRERATDIAALMTAEQGKPLAESKMELMGAADVIDYCAEEGRRTYGRLIPARAPGVTQQVIQEPVGPVAAFTPWNFPVNQVVRKVSAALAAGCSIIVKAPEETPASPAGLIRAFADAGLPPGVLNLVYGIPSEVSNYLIPHPVIRKISFTGSTPVGKQLAALAGTHMKRATMELGGHAPAIVFDDADLDSAVTNLVGGKFRNCGQVCVAPTRFLVQRGVFDAFVSKMVAAVEQLKVGAGSDGKSTLGPLIHARRLAAVEAMVADAIAKGATLKAGGKRIDRAGYFFEPTVLTNVPDEASAMTDEPFGPVALVNVFDTVEEVIAIANKLNFGLAAYAYTGSAKTAALLTLRVETGMLSINHQGLALPETPFGGVKDSGYGSEGGPEALTAYLQPKFVTRRDF